MENYLEISGVDHNFVLFGKIHLITMIIMIIFNLILILGLKKLNSLKVNNIVRIILALFMLTYNVFGMILLAILDKWSVKDSLPLHICNLSIMISIIVLYKKNQFFYDILYFWGLSGTLQAIVTPDLEYNFPHFYYFYYNILHMLIITTILIMTLIYKFRPTLKSLKRAFIAINCYVTVIAIVNYILGSNYAYTCQKPRGNTIMNYLGPWPWYIIFLEIIAIFSFGFYYLPFFIIDLKKKARLE